MAQVTDLSRDWGLGLSRAGACIGVDEEDGRAGRNSGMFSFVFGDSDANLTEEERMAKKHKKHSNHRVKKGAAEASAEAAILRQYVAFVPRKVLPELPEMAIAEPRIRTLQGVVSFLDVAGFTKLTERLALQSDGAERLAKIINKLMGQMLNTCPTGDVIKFSGDAILVLYEPDRNFMPDDAPPAARKKGKNPYDDMPAMRNAAYRAVSEGIKALHDDYTVKPEELGSFSTDPDDPVTRDGIKLALHVAITAGNLQLMHVGGVFGRWEVVMAGEAMQILGATADNAPTDHLCVEKNCYELLESDPTGLKFEGERLPPPNEEYVRILRELGDGAMGIGALLDPVLNPMSSVVGGIVDIMTDNTHEGLGLRMIEGHTDDELSILRRYVSPVIQKAIATKTLEAVSCFTDVTVLFVGISGVDLGMVNPDANMLIGQMIMSATQDCVYDHEGSVNKFVMDDKGALLLCAWGLPPMAHVDDPRRATAAAIELAATLEEFGIQAHIGVTTGKVFAGVIGPPHRCEYSLLGDTVNLSARLMCKAPFGGVLTDDNTYTSAVQNGIEFEVLDPIKVKGKENIVKIYKPLKDTTADAHAKKGAPHLRASVWGGKQSEKFESGATLLAEGNMRTQEKEELFQIIDSLYVEGGGVLVLSGDAGSGKSELAKMVTSSTDQYGAKLIQSLTPKQQGKSSDIAAKPCSELSQVMRGLLLKDGEEIEGLLIPEGRPKTVAEWEQRMRDLIPDVSLHGLTHLFSAYFEEWVQLDGNAVEGASAGDDSEADQSVDRKSEALERLRAKTGSPRAAQEKEVTNSASSQPGDAAGRLKLLTAVLDHLLQTGKPILIFVHVRTGSNLAGGTHPEMWGLLSHLADYGVMSYKRGPQSKSQALVVALTHRRVLDFGGREMNKEYAKVIEDARNCNGLLTLDPLDAEDREKYLCLSLRVCKVPLAVSRWVSNTANGNPQYIEICAKQLQDENVITTSSREEAVLGSQLPQAQFTADGQVILANITVPPKIMGYVKTTLGSLGPRDKLLVQVLSLFNLEEDNGQPLPTKLVLHRAYSAIAEIDEHDLVTVLDNLGIFGLVDFFDGKDNTESHLISTRSSFIETDEVHRSSLYYTISYPLLRETAYEMLLANQKNAILETMAPRKV
jgi:class 3 adenylate cyclase